MTDVVGFTKEGWTAGLRSGDFQQVDSVLKGEIYNDDEEVVGVGYCCLGVGMELDPEADPEMDEDKADRGATEMPHPAILARWGLKKEDADNLAQMNDNKEPFSKIADAIDDLPPFVPYEY